MENLQNSKWTVAKMNWCITRRIDRAFADTDYANVLRPHTGGSNQHLAGDAPLLADDWPHTHRPRLRHDGIKRRCCRCSNPNCFETAQAIQSAPATINQVRADF